MKVSELIKDLQRLAKDDDPEVVISIDSWYRSGPVSYESIYQLNRYTGQEIRLQTSLGKEFVIRQKSK